MITKLNTYVFSLPALSIVHNYLSSRKQGTKTDYTYSNVMEILFGVPEGLILGPLLLNIFLLDLFFILNNADVPVYSVDNTPYLVADKINDLIQSLEGASEALFQRFDKNLSKSNPDKNFIYQQILMKKIRLRSITLK